MSEESFESSSTPSIKLIVGDSLRLLPTFPDHSVPIILTGVPDIEELGMESVDDYLLWMTQAAQLLFSKTRPEGYVIFVQTDRKIGGEWIDKSYYLTDVATQMGWRLMWHKLCLNRPVGSANLHRPTYSHILCYSIKGRPGNSLPDVVDAGKRLYNNATPLGALELIFDFLEAKRSLQKPDGYTIVDPFVGQGSVPYLARENGWSCLGIDLDPDQIRSAKTFLQL